jgi:pilus assembly protein CpaC
MSQSNKHHGINRQRRATLVLGGATAALLAMLVGGSIADETTPATQPAAQVSAQADEKRLVESGIGANGKLELTLNKTAVISTRTPYKRVSVGQPEIADVNPIAPTSLLVTAKKAGTTQLIIWDDSERSQVVDISVMHDLAQLEDQLKEMFPDSKISVEGANGSVVLRGRVPSLQVAEQVAELAAPYVTENNKVMNFLEISGGQQVLLKVRFAEVSRGARRSLGFNAFATDGVGRYGWNNGPGADPIGAVASGAADAEINPAVTLFGAGQIGRTRFEMFVEALRENNMLRLLAEPNLIAISGQEANFLAGGEFPVPVPQPGGGGTSITIEYREFGVRLKFTPVVLGDGRIRLKVNPEVSELDFSTAVRFSGFVTPGLTKRSVETTIELNEGQTFAIAGLLNNNVNASRQVTPLLGDLPVLGALFRSVRYERKETELVVLVTPELVEGVNPDEVQTLPGEFWRHPNDLELFLNRDIGGEMKEEPADARRKTPPAFHGAYGFQPAPVAAVEEE